ncbi:MAG: DNA cytosine methyltransferase [Bacteroidales bacterium]|nr:DNA cytosine methyltransferase [Bacteroidales bacterium]
MIKTFGSLCSGIEVASLVFKPMGLIPLWFSEIAEFPSRFLKNKYPNTPNWGDMNDLPELIKSKKIEAPDLLSGGTPCQAFSLAGTQNGLNDHRGQLTLKYIEIADEIDNVRAEQGKQRAVLFWENVEGVLSDRTNAFGCFLAGLAGFDKPIEVTKWTNAGVLKSAKRNIAWRVLDGKYFGLPQQRRRLYLLAGDKNFNPENVLFEVGHKIIDPFKVAQRNKPMLSLFADEQEQDFNQGLTKTINGNEIEIFRTYTDCLYAAYGTKWNGNAAAYNGSLYITQNKKLRRITPLECERLMGLPDNYTLINGSSHTNRYQAVGNSWAVTVVQWIAQRLLQNNSERSVVNTFAYKKNNYSLDLVSDFQLLDNGKYLNGTSIPYDYKLANLIDFVDTNAQENFYISSKGCAGILRRKNEKNIKINERLEKVLSYVSSLE